MNRPLSRRMLLRGLGVALPLPLLEAMGRPAKAAQAKVAPPHRMVCVGVDLSFHPESFFPTSAGRDYPVSPTLKPIEMHRKDFTVFSHLDHPGVNTGHRGAHAYLSGVLYRDAKARPEGNITIDQRAAEAISGRTRFPSVHLGMGPGAVDMSFTRAGVAVPTINKPRQFFEALFVDEPAGARQARQQRFAADRSVLDIVLAQAKSLHGKLGTADREKMDEYLNSIREVEGKIGLDEKWVDKPKPKAGQLPTDSYGWAQIEESAPLLYELIFLALKTDSSRIATLQFETTGAAVGLPGVTDGYHLVTHHGQLPERLAQLAIIERYLVKALGGFLDRLKNEREGDRTMLDRTMVLFGSGLGNANSHSSRDFPILLAGGGFKHGRHLVCPRMPTHGTPLCNLFVNMLQRFGVETESFGTSTGRISELEFAS